MRYTTLNVFAVKAVVLATGFCYPFYDDANYTKTKIMVAAFVGYLALYGFVLSVFRFDAPISYKRLMSLITSTIISVLSSKALFFDEDNYGRSMLDGHQSYWSLIAINTEIGIYIADCITITKDQFAITPLIVHHVLGVVVFSYSMLRQLFTLMTCYGLLQEACNPFWYAHQLLYGWRSYRKSNLKGIFFVNAILTVLVYIVVRFLMVKPNALVCVYETLFACAQCTLFDKVYSFMSTFALICVNSLNLFKLVKSVIKAWGESFSLPNEDNNNPAPLNAAKAKSVKSH